MPDRRYDLSEETTIIIHEDGTATLEVLYDNDVAAIALTAIEVARLRITLNEIESTSA